MSKEHELLSLGGQAAAAAHSLGTPLSTITVVVTELEKEIGKSESIDYKDWRKAASKSTLYKNFVENRICCMRIIINCFIAKIRVYKR